MTLCDASALIALINARDRNHDRCVNALPQLSAPLITTWPCYTETMHHLSTTEQSVLSSFSRERLAHFTTPQQPGRR